MSLFSKGNLALKATPRKVQHFSFRPDQADFILIKERNSILMRNGVNKSELTWMADRPFWADC
jgi:hypothetical protein